MQKSTERDSMSDLIQQVVDGKIPESKATTTTSKETSTRGTTNLGQDAFLQLLVAEMQNQDPLEPTTNTEWISQLATFSQLEELQSLSKATENSQLFSLIGKNVIISTTDSAGRVSLKEGMVDFVSMSGGEAKFSVNGNLYSINDLYSVVDEDYLYEKSKPGLKEAYNLTFNGDKPEDLTFEVDLGSGIAKAKNLAIVIGNTVLSSEYVSLSGTTVTIRQELLQELQVGTYEFSVVFDDERMTTADDVLTINIYNSHPTPTEDSETTEAETTEETEEA